MSVQLIQQYHAKVEKIIRYGGSRNEGSVRKPFQDLLEQYARQRNLELIGELEYRTRRGHTVYPDGTLKDALRQDWGYWESKDEKDDLEAEIATKFAKGYPANNILFEDTQTAVLYQAGEEVGRVDFRDATALDALLARFVSYENEEVRQFREAIENFSRDIPPLVWEYKLGNRSAVEWVLDRYKERKPRDPTIREKFNSYRFRDYKEDVIELIGRVTAVSLATMQIIEQMPAE
jgi:hypothetical protein